jgi:uncharacterized protein (DUF2342 family)
VAGSHHPPAIELEFDQVGICLAEQHIVADLAVPLVFEFKIVVVVGVLQSGGLGLDADAVGQLGGALEIVEGEVGEVLDEALRRFFLPNAGLRRLFRGRNQDGTDGVVRAQCMCLVKQGAGIVGRETKVGAGAAKTGVVDGLAKIGGGEIGEASGLDVI